MHRAWLTSGDLVWRRVATETPAPALRSRSLFTLALIYCESGQHRDRLPRLFAAAAEMQVTDASHADYGNFRWQWQHPGVLDQNAVEFCMRTATLLWTRHHKSLADDVRPQMLSLMRRGAVACQRRLVDPAYTNIALMNANNLILLGEILQEPRLSAEGERRFQVVAELARDFGFMEYDSPTYLGVTINLLQQLATCPTNGEVRAQAQTLLDLAWLHVAANWLPDAQRLAGAHSRSYDYLRASGELEAALWAAGWIDEPPFSVRYSVYAIAGGTPLPASPEQVLRGRGVAGKFPRTIEQRVGPAPRQTRTTWIGRTVAVGSSGADHGTTDVPLAVDFRDARHVRGYVMFDDRGDIFSERPFARGGHVKAEHIRPFWTSVQRGPDAIGLAVFDVAAAANSRNLATSFIFPSTVDETWINGRRYHADEPTLPHHLPLAADTSIVLRNGSSAAAVKFVWTRNQQGTAGKLSLQRTDDSLGAVALVAELYSDERYQPAAAALWVRVAEGLDDAAFTAWRKSFEQTTPLVDARRNQVRIELASDSDPLRLVARGPWDERATVVRRPAETASVLSINGQPLADELLRAAGTKRNTAGDEASPIVDLHWRASEAVTLFAPMQVDATSAGIGAPAELGISAEIAGRASWQVNVPESGRYRLWAEGLAPSPATNSFYFRLTPQDAATGKQPPRTYWGVWSLPPGDDWGTHPVQLEASQRPGLYDLRRGRYRLDLFVREPGTWVRAFRLTPDLGWRP